MCLLFLKHQSAAVTNLFHGILFKHVIVATDTLLGSHIPSHYKQLSTCSSFHEVGLAPCGSHGEMNQWPLRDCLLTLSHIMG